MDKSMTWSFLLWEALQSWIITYCIAVLNSNIAILSNMLCWPLHGVEQVKQSPTLESRWEGSEKEEEEVFFV